jgi:hypothetical protein
VLSKSLTPGTTPTPPNVKNPVESKSLTPPITDAPPALIKPCESKSETAAMVTKAKQY